jgi:hypothetical protein
MTPNCPPILHQISARAKVKFTALQDLNTTIFELHNGLRVTKVFDEKDQPLAAERVAQDSTVRLPLPRPSVVLIAQGLNQTISPQFALGGWRHSHCSHG